MLLTDMSNICIYTVSGLRSNPPSVHFAEIFGHASDGLVYPCRGLAVSMENCGNSPLNQADILDI
jgi:hypothetical protein